MKSLEQRSREFATKAHESINQKRKYTGEPYIHHPMAVVDILRKVPHNEVMLAAAWLHDVVEDTPVTLQQIEEEFGSEVKELVRMVTDISCPEDGNRKERKKMDRKHLSNASPEAKTIKLADLIHNSESITKYDPSFAKVYMREKQLLLLVLQEGNSVLYKKAQKIIKDYYNGNV